MVCTIPHAEQIVKSVFCWSDLLVPVLGFCLHPELAWEVILTLQLGETNAAVRSGPRDLHSRLVVCQVVVPGQAVGLEHHVCELATGNLDLV